MNIEDFRDYCLSLPQAKENTPWTEPQYQDLVTFTVADKWFCLLDLENKFCDIKCSVDQVAALQEKYTGIQPAWHMNKTHWVKLVLGSDVPISEIEALVKQSYEMIVASLTKSKRQELGLTFLSHR